MKTEFEKVFVVISVKKTITLILLFHQRLHRTTVLKVRNIFLLTLFIKWRRVIITHVLIKYLVGVEKKLDYSAILHVLFLI